MCMIIRPPYRCVLEYEVDPDLVRLIWSSLLTKKTYSIIQYGHLIPR